MKLRWLVTKFSEPTIDHVKELRELTGMGIQMCKEMLTTPVGKVLQQNTSEFGENWVDIPTVIFHDTSENTPEKILQTFRDKKKLIDQRGDKNA